jgi:hypothetical protein
MAFSSSTSRTLKRFAIDGSGNYGGYRGVSLDRPALTQGWPRERVSGGSAGQEVSPGDLGGERRRPRAEGRLIPFGPSWGRGKGPAARGVGPAFRGRLFPLEPGGSYNGSSGTGRLADQKAARGVTGGRSFLRPTEPAPPLPG